jgi:hypothetical protein
LTNLVELTAVYEWPLPDEKSFRRQAEKGLEKEGPAVVQLLNQTGETPMVAGAGSDGLAVVTDKRTIVSNVARSAKRSRMQTFGRPA